jgi:protein TonB
MFADSLLESHFDHTHRGWTTFASFGLQMLGVAVLLMLPLIYTEGLPKMHLLSPIGPPPGRPPAAQQHSGIRHGESNMFHDTVVIPPSIPIGVTEVHDESLPQDAPPCDVCVPYSTGLSSSANSIANSIGTSTTIVPPPPTPRSARIQGQVLLRAIISRTGTIENPQTISGHPMRVGAAVDAVRQWRYRPYILNGEPVEVETQVTVNFSLSGG